MNTEEFLQVLSKIDRNYWNARVEPRRPVGLFGDCIFLNRKGSDILFSPLTCVYYELTGGKEIDRGSYWCEELQREFGFPWWEVLAIAYSQLKCGLNYDKILRNSILSALGLPKEEIY